MHRAYLSLIALLRAGIESRAVRHTGPIIAELKMRTMWRWELAYNVAVGKNIPMGYRDVSRKSSTT